MTCGIGLLADPAPPFLQKIGEDVLLVPNRAIWIDSSSGGIYLLDGQNVGRLNDDRLAEIRRATWTARQEPR
jgi:hypothetical protein